MTWRKYYLVKVEVEKLELSTTYVVFPNGKVREDGRSIQEMEQAAADSGHEVSYCSNFWGMSSQRFEEVRRAITKDLSGRMEIGHWSDVDIEFTTKVLVPEEKNQP